MTILLKKSSSLSIIIIVAFIFAVIIGMLIIKSNNASSISQNIPKENVALPTPKYSDWTYFKNGYGIKIPSDWKNTSDLGGTAVLEPGSTVGSITKVSITFLSDKKAPQGQRFTTQKEFDEWHALNGNVQGKIQKIGNTSIDGGEALVLQSNSEANNAWTIIAWTRKDNSNVYITINGNGKYSAEDSGAINYLISSFKFQAPPSTGKEEK